ncbi:GNAT family N-acetyltransferase [Microbulbifer sp. VAAF005]|uniref:GNAT family N-acetyltransferase n=1 Tax=Microbulbifer sp. VAAF005 TaxID=3034230 RepID=UPI0024AC89EA|nr:GNAT family N-acetyltransferase [Microbulbifer sp. VAAF005]WHI45809.1 GNAT family N-acetyltransferase [Microbulbifer sp. VAAF005]
MVLAGFDVDIHLKVDLANYDEPEDAKSVVALMEEYALHPFGGGEPLSELCRSSLVPALKEFPGAFSILAYRGEAAVGLVNCFTGFSTFLCKPLINIHDVVVSESARGLGVCTAMMDFLAKEAKRRGCCKLTLEVLQRNYTARAAYLKTGFKPYTLDEEMGQAEFWQRYL